MTDLETGDLHSCERLNLPIVNTHMRKATDAIQEAGGDLGQVWLCGRAVTAGLLLDLAEAAQPPMFLPETDLERSAEGWKGYYRGVAIRQVRPEWNRALAVSELWVMIGDERFAVIRDNEIMESMSGTIAPRVPTEPVAPPVAQQVTRRQRRAARRQRRDPIERRIEKLVDRLDAEKFEIAVEYDTNQRHHPYSWAKKDWRVTIRWCRRGWRDYPKVAP